MSLKIRDAGGTMRTITAIKIRDAGGVVRTITSVKVRDTGGVLREVFTTGGGGGPGPGPNPAVITPSYASFSGKATFRAANFTASAGSETITSYSWGLIDGPGTVTAGGATATATLQVYAVAGDAVSATFFCDLLIGGTTYRAICGMDYQNTLQPA